MTTQHQITLPEPDWLERKASICYPEDVELEVWGTYDKLYTADTVRTLLAAAVAKERENQDAPAKVVLQQMRRITELEAENAQLREQNETQRYEIQALEEKVAELRGKRVALSDEWIRERCSHAWVFETVKHWVKEVEAAHGIGEAL